MDDNLSVTEMECLHEMLCEVRSDPKVPEVKIISPDGASYATEYCVVTGRSQLPEEFSVKMTELGKQGWSLHSIKATEGNEEDFFYAVMSRLLGKIVPVGEVG